MDTLMILLGIVVFMLVLLSGLMLMATAKDATVIALSSTPQALAIHSAQKHPQAQARTCVLGCCP